MRIEIFAMVMAAMPAVQAAELLLYEEAFRTDIDGWEQEGVFGGDDIHAEWSSEGINDPGSMLIIASDRNQITTYLSECVAVPSTDSIDQIHLKAQTVPS